MNPDPAKREKAWRRLLFILCGISLLFCALAIYGIKRLETDSKPRIHNIQEVNQFRVDSNAKQHSTK